ncbi:hypothetical protein B0H15DRAFT_951368 [Mycena belliarum]|uniref:Uncharacterized protein n=1 Tax=Mycena belliarum TaxID=1033014 RepID=A0AAD6U1B7_9AGAR|nr:hypothetical protein B0H15DRAFT_951368 [Mycena belliae]
MPPRSSPDTSTPDSIFSEEPDAPDPDVQAISYHVSTTTTITGLPPYEQTQLLRAYRTRFYQSVHTPTCQVAEVARATDYGVFLSYDLCCQYYKNLHALDTADSHSDPDWETGAPDDGDDDTVPALLPLTPSDSGDAVLPPAGIPPAPAEPALRSGLEDGEHVERAWAYMNPPSGSGRHMGAAFRRDQLDVDGNFHSLRIISLDEGVRDVLCDCADGEHSAYVRSRAYAFPDAIGNVVVKKSKTLLWPLN